MLMSATAGKLNGAKIADIIKATVDKSEVLTDRCSTGVGGSGSWNGVAAAGTVAVAVEWHFQCAAICGWQRDWVLV